MTTSLSEIYTTHHGFGGKIALEFGSDNTRIAMGSGDFAPDAAKEGALGLRFSLVDICHSLATVPCHLLLCVHSLYLH
jgi:hypothetical protein